METEGRGEGAQTLNQGLGGTSSAGGAKGTGDDSSWEGHAGSSNTGGDANDDSCDPTYSYGGGGGGGYYGGGAGAGNDGSDGAGGGGAGTSFVNASYTPTTVGTNADFGSVGFEYDTIDATTTTTTTTTTSSTTSTTTTTQPTTTTTTQPTTTTTTQPSSSTTTTAPTTTTNPEVTTTVPSTTTTLPPTNVVTPDIENAGPNGGDANGDHQQDSTQANVSSFISPVTHSYVVFEAPSGCSNEATSVNPESTTNKDANYTYPAGLLNFTITCVDPGSTVTVSQYFYGLNSTAKDFIARKYNSVTGQYLNLDGASVTDVSINGTPAIKLSYSLKDGGPLDQDGKQTARLLTLVV